MPCWFYDKKDLLNTPSARDGISPETEAWYRKEGAKHIMDAGNKLGLRFDTCATGVVYFHRFYMFHSFKEFHRLVTAACCLFLAGKVEETPKKCKDIIKTFRSMLNDAQFAHFGEDPKEEVMTLERILLQTIKFDLMVEHPYAYLLKFAKLVKGDKAKIQKMVQMAWTFINDSLCTTLCLQWEPEIVAVAVMYLTSRLNKFDINDWQGKPLGYRGKWYEFLVEDVTLDLLEDICHQVLDLYSNAPQPQKDVGNSPAPVRVRQPPLSSDDDQSRTPRTPKSPHGVKRPAPSTVTGTSQSADSDIMPPAAKERERTTTHMESQSSSSRPGGTYTGHQVASAIPTAGAPAASMTAAPASSSYTLANPYMSTQMYSSSFMSTEGSQSIQSLVGTQATNAAAHDEHGTAGQAAQGRPSGYSTSAAAYQQQFLGGHVGQQYPPTASSQGSSVAGTSAGAHRSEFSSGSVTAAAGSYRGATGGYQGSSSSSTASYGQQQQQYSAYQQPPTSQQTGTEGAAGFAGATYMAAAGQPQYPPSGAATAQSTSPVYQSYSGGRSGSSAYGTQTTAGGSQQQLQQQRYQTNQSAASATYQSHSTPSAGYQSQSASGSAYHSQQGSSNAGYQSHSAGGYQSRASSSVAYSSQQPSTTAPGYHQSTQQSYPGREQSGGSGYHGQSSSGSSRSGGSGSQQQSSSSSRGQNWGY